MKIAFGARLAMDATAAILLMVAMAYYWLDNQTHEWIGMGVFLLIIVHNTINRHWYGALHRKRREAPRVFDTVMTFSLLLTMLALLIISVIVSQTVFGFLAIDDDFSARQIHAFAAYWAVMLVAIHIGIRWHRVMNAVKNRLRITTESRVRRVVLRVVAIALALCGLQSALTLDIASKLTLQMSLEWWDFETSTMGFFLAWISTIGLFAVLSHYSFKALLRLKRPRGRPGPSRT